LLLCWLPFRHAYTLPLPHRRHTAHLWTHTHHFRTHPTPAPHTHYLPAHTTHTPRTRAPHTPRLLTAHTHTPPTPPRPSHPRPPRATTGRHPTACPDLTATTYPRLPPLPAFHAAGPACATTAGTPQARWRCALRHTFSARVRCRLPIPFLPCRPRALFHGGRYLLSCHHHVTTPPTYLCRACLTLCCATTAYRALHLAARVGCLHLSSLPVDATLLLYYSSGRGGGGP